MYFSFSILGATALLLARSAMADVPLVTNATEFSTLADSANGFPSQTFRSSDIVAPVFLVNRWEQDQVDPASFIFLGTVYGENKAGPMIFDAHDMSLVYADQKYENAYTSNIYFINGTRYFAFWEGGHTRGHANGNCLFFDESYNLQYNVTAQGLNDARADMHELSVTPSGTVIFSTYFNIPFDCRSVGGPEDALLMDSGFQEIDPVTNELIFDWHASKFFDINNSYAVYNSDYGVGPDSGFDFFHINSVEKTEEGNYLVSSRHMSILTLIDGRDGHPIWVLGGRQNQFIDLSNGEATNFSWQHDARIIPSSDNVTDETHITLFDNHGEYSGPCQEKCGTRALHIAINPISRTARVATQFFHPESIDSGAMGGYQTLGSGNIMTGWGYYPGFVEYKSDGTPVMDFQRGMIGGEPLPDMFAYRVNKGNWAGKPSWPPSVAADAPNNNTLDATIYVSWNGATDVASWAIFASNDHSTISNYTNLIAESPRNGFETALHLTNTNITCRYVGAAAVSTSSEVLGSTVVIDLQNGGNPVTVTSDIITLKPPSSTPSSPSSSAAKKSSNTDTSSFIILIKLSYLIYII
ncbi:arylsulfotransferase [Trichoderma arundinaceum]|uniref:Arylsulfotransferase n=1 Tax=Trichoderma arundinaceum TaxID=490622 RepID=A0A395NIM6_TRIAR|nr:arylsulfotransferase [Trichoderma arundinaceum]